ncbi:MAG: helicase-exonuclease AddAB subunit AddA [Cellulosilyticaceae bacterium]
MGWTVGQQAAIDTRDANVLVSAAAGSGKTAVLTERVFRRVMGSEDEAGIDIDRFLIVTFTSAAAQEMKERIADKLSGAIEKLQEEAKNEEVIEKITYLEKQLSLLGKASISTIHAFCLKTIKNYFNHLDSDPNMKVGDESELHLMKLDILEEILEQYFESEDNEDFLMLADTYGSVRGLEPLVELILKVHTFSKSTTFPNKWLDEMAEALMEKDMTIGASRWDQMLLQDIQEALAGIVNLYDEAIRLTKMPGGPALYEPVLQDDVKQIQEAYALEKIEMLEALQDITFGRLPTKKQECTVVLKERVKGYRELVKDMIGELKYKASLLCDQTLREKTLESGKLMVLLVALVKEFDTRYHLAKKEKNVVDYSDLEHMCLQLFVTQKVDEEGNVELGYTEVAKELGDFYEEIYIDEYQDSNMVQEMILGSIALSKDRGPTRFMVGDMKQSIYRFRLANPLIFADKYNRFQKYQEVEVREEGSRVDLCIDLSQNFRSRENILATTNDLFEQVMGETVGELTYDEDAKLKVGNLYDAGFTEDLSEAIAQKVEVHVMELGEKESSNEEESTLDDMKGIEVEAKMVAELISKLLKGEANPSKVFDKDLGCYRQVEAKDIVILLRSVKEKAQIFEEALLERGIGAYADVSGNFFESNEVQTMLAMMQIIDNPRQDIPLLTVLRSPIVRLDFDEILRIRKHQEDVDFYTALQGYIKEGLGDTVLTAFYESLLAYREMSTLLPLEELVSKLLSDTGYYRYVAMLPAGAKKKANLKMLKKYAEDYERSIGVGLFGFLQYMGQLEKTGANVSEAKIVGESENLVRIMTIHKSKGLEFPIVFVCNTDKKFNNQDLMQNVLMHQELGFGPKYVDEAKHVMYETIPFQAIKSKITRENISEEVRVLYVALTRAKEKLYITGTVKDMARQVEKWAQFGVRSTEGILPLGLRKTPTYLNWIGTSLFAHKDFEKLRDMAEVTCQYLFEGNGDWALEVWQKEDLQIQEQHLEETKHQRQSALEEWDVEASYSEWKDVIASRLNYQYPYEKATTLPVKVAVSELKKKEQVAQLGKSPFENSEKKEPIFVKDETMKATTRGTLVHSVLEQVDLGKLKTSEAIEGEISRLIREGRLDEDVRKVISIEKIVSMANSSMQARMKAANHVFKEKAFVYLLPAKEVDEQYPEDESMLMQGIVDTCFIEDDGIVIVDYKTDYIDMSQKEASIQAIKERYRIQLELYSEALGSIMKKDVKENWLYLYHIDEWIEL